MTLTSILTYEKHRLPAIIKDGQKWIGADALSAPLGLSDRSSLRKIITRHKRDFGPEEAQMIVAQTSGGPQKRWFLSRQGAELVAFYANTPEGTLFRRWCFRSWQSWRAGGEIVQPLQPATNQQPVGTQARRVMDLIQSHLEQDHPAMAVIEGIREGKIALHDDPLLSTAISLWHKGQDHNSLANRSFTEARAAARSLGYTDDQLKAIATWKRSQKEAPTFPLLDVEGV